MQKISELTSTADTNGEFTNGSVASGVSPTNLDAGWFNTVQRELVALVQGGGLTLDPDNDAQVLAAVQALLAAQDSGRLLNVQLFTTAGAYSYTPSTGTKTIDVTVVGAGGGGGGTPATSSSQVSAASGGGGGGTAKSRLLVSNLTFPLTITVGKGGTAGTGTTTPTTGGTSSFGSLLSATGGSAGGNGVTVTAGSTYLISNGGGGLGVGGNQMNIKGGPGGRAIILAAGWESGEGGASTQSAGGDPIASSSSIAGVTGRLGAGGSGAFAIQSSAVFAGGAGGDGVVIVAEYS